MKHAQILSVVLVIDDRQNMPVQSIQELHKEVSSKDLPFEIILVVNTQNLNILQQIHTQSSTLSNLQVYALKTPVDNITANMVGIENAIGDWVATFDLETDDPSIIGKFYDTAIQDGAEVVLSVSENSSTQKNIKYNFLSFLYHRIFKILHGYNLAEEAPSARLLSRTVVNHILQHNSPLVALETLTVADSYRKAKVSQTPKIAAAPSLTERVQTRWRTLIGISAAPLRAANLLCGISASLAFLYSIYVLVVFMVKKDVVPGWTTLSFIISLMFMMLSLVLWLLSEYLILLLNPGSRQASYEITQEFSSNVQTRRQQLNVEVEL